VSARKLESPEAAARLAMDLITDNDDDREHLWSAPGSARGLAPDSGSRGPGLDHFSGLSRRPAPGFRLSGPRLTCRQRRSPPRRHELSQLPAHCPPVVALASLTEPAKYGADRRPRVARERREMRGMYSTSSWSASRLRAMMGIRADPILTRLGSHLDRDTLIAAPRSPFETPVGSPE
jgi:hypothetical protein